MSETKPETASEKIAEAEKLLQAAETGGAASEAEKTETARGIYLTWRNGSLGNLPTESFNRIEAESGALIAAIAAKLT